MYNTNRKRILIASGIALAVILIVIIALVINSKSKEGLGDVAEVKFKMTNISLDEVKKAGFPDNLYQDLSRNIFDSMGILEPTCTKNTSAKNVKNENNHYTFTIVRCNTTYDIALDLVNNKDYSFTISNSGTELIAYDSTQKEKSYKSKNSLQKILPLNFTTTFGTISVTIPDIEKPTELKVGISSCGDETIKNNALEATRVYLEQGGYNPDDFTYSVPNYCDKEY